MQSPSTWSNHPSLSQNLRFDSSPLSIASTAHYSTLLCSTLMRLFFNEPNQPKWTVRYCALELIRSSDGRNLDLKKADIFSFGAAMYELCLSRELGEAQTSIL